MKTGNPWINGSLALIRDEKFIQVLFTIGQIFNIIRFTENELTKQKNVQAFQVVSLIKADIILYDEYISPVLQVRLAHLHEKGYSMGWGTFWGDGSDNGVPQNLRAQLVSSEAVKTALVLAGREDVMNFFPSYRELLNQNYHIKQIILGPNMYAWLYEKNKT